MALTHDTRRALAERVQRRVEGRGIPRHVIEDAVARVGDALDQESRAPSGLPERGELIAVFAATSAPDLASRVRAALASESVAPQGIGTNTTGRHTVATVRITSSARAVAERVATRLAVSVSFVQDPSFPSQ